MKRTARHLLLIAPLVTGVAMAKLPPKAHMILPGSYPEAVLTMTAADPAMDRAIRRARNGLADFLKFHKSPKHRYEKFAVRVVLYWGNEREYIWIRDFKQRDDSNMYAGKVAGRIYMQTGFRPGDQFTFVRGDIIDWTYTDTRTQHVHGAYTECALMTLAPADVAAEYRKDRKPDCDF